MRKILYSIVVGVMILGNFGFVRVIFGAAHRAGTNILSNGTIFMVTDDNHRRPYTSEGAFLSYGFNSWNNVVTASIEDNFLPVDSFIPPRDGKIVCSDRGEDKGTCYLITNGKRAAFVSEKVFKDLGFSFGKALKGDVSFLEKDLDISDSSSQHRPGVLINKNGTFFLVSASGLIGIPSVAVLKSWGYSLDDAVNYNSADNLPHGAVINTRYGANLVPTQVDKSYSYQQVKSTRNSSGAVSDTIFVKNLLEACASLFPQNLISYTASSSVSSFGNGLFSSHIIITNRLTQLSGKTWNEIYNEIGGQVLTFDITLNPF